MNLRVKKLIMILAIAIMLHNLVVQDYFAVYSVDRRGEIDLFTQKEPFCGRGFNVTSDAFAFGEEVVVFALVTYGGNPVAQISVTFKIEGPKNHVENITFWRSGYTNSTGIATISFRLPYLKETTFGLWKVTGNTKVGNAYFEDVLTFKVGWIVEIISLRTIDQNHVEQSSFKKGTSLGLELTLRNIAMTKKIATIRANIFDCLNLPINSSELTDFFVEPNETSVLAYFFIHIPITACVGLAEVHVSAYAVESGREVPYCPEVSQSFMIVSGRFFLEVKTDPYGLVAIPGRGWYDEYVNVTLSAPEFVIISEKTRYKFHLWAINELSEFTESYLVSILMDQNHTLIAKYNLQYHLSVKSQFGNVGGAGWYDSGSIAYVMLDFGLHDYGNGSRIIFDRWDGDSSGTNHLKSNPITMDGPKTAIAKWKNQFLISFDVLGLDSTAIGQVALVNSSLMVFTDFPFYQWVDKDVKLTYSYQDRVSSNVVGKRFKLVNISGSGSPIVVVSPMSVIGYYKIQYYLSVRTEPSGIVGIAGEGWYDRFENVTLFAAEVSSYHFKMWDIDGSHQPAGVYSVSLTMDAPHTATAHYLSALKYVLKIIASEGGTTEPKPGEYSCSVNSIISVEAIPSSDYVFDHWELDGSNVGSDNPYFVLMDGNHTLKPVFSAVSAKSFVFAPEWFFLFLFLILLLMFLLLLVFLIKRKKRKKANEEFHAGWTAWYYKHILPRQYKFLKITY